VIAALAVALAIVVVAPAGRGRRVFAILRLLLDLIVAVTEIVSLVRRGRRRKKAQGDGIVACPKCSKKNRIRWPEDAKCGACGTPLGQG